MRGALRVFVPTTFGEDRRQKEEAFDVTNQTILGIIMGVYPSGCLKAECRRGRQGMSPAGIAIPLGWCSYPLPPYRGYHRRAWADHGTLLCALRRCASGR